MLNAEAITVPLMCEQTECFGSAGTIHYVMTPRMTVSAEQLFSVR